MKWIMFLVGLMIACFVVISVALLFVVIYVSFRILNSLFQSQIDRRNLMRIQNQTRYVKAVGMSQPRSIVKSNFNPGWWNE